MMKRLVFLVMVCLLIGSVSGYTNYVTYSYNITAPMGTQTNYPVKFIFSNATGTSGYYAPDNVIFTNGVTRPDWVDINASNGAGTYYPFWVENNTYTAKNATVWVNVPSIAVGNTSTGRWDYGDASQSASTMDGLNTFPILFDDFSGSTLNTSVWTKTGSMTVVQNGGFAKLTSTADASNQGIYTTEALSKLNMTVVSRFNVTTYGSASYITNYAIADITPPTGGFWVGNTLNAASNAGKWVNYNGAATFVTATGLSSGTQSVVSGSRNATAVLWTVDGSNAAINTLNIPTSDGRVTFYTANVVPKYYVDWLYAKPYLVIEPTTSSYSTSATGTPLASNFTANTTVGYMSPWAVAFTDTTTGSPTTWNWTFGDTYTSTSQNPTHIYTVAANNYTVTLNTTNSTGFSLVTKYIELKTDDDTWLKSWMQFENLTVIDLKGAAWVANNAATSTTQKKWGTRSLDVTLNDAYLTASSSALWDWGSQNAVMEFWVYPTTIVANKNLIARSTGTGTGNVTGWALRSNSSGTGYYWRMGANTTPSFTLPLNTWTLVKIERDGAYVEIYKNGVIESDTFMPGIYDTANPIYIGQVSGGADNTLYLDEFRFTNGISREVGAYSPNYAAYNGNLYTNWININSNATFRTKINPEDFATAIIYNQSYGGLRNRTIQIQNITNATYISGKMDFRPNVMMAQRVNLNKSTYADLVLTSSSIDPVNGIVNFNVSRSAGVSALFDNRTNLLDVEMLYWNYTTETQIPMYFAQGDLIDGQHNAAYPIMNFIATNVTIGDWGTPLTTPTADNVTPQSYQTVQFLGNSTNYPNAWNWSFGDGTYSSLQSPTHQYTSNGLKTVSLTGYQSLNASITNTTTLTNYINVSGNALSGFTRQDLVMSPQFTLQVTFVDSSTNLPIPVVTVMDSIGGNQTTSTGVFTGTYEYSTVVLYAFSSGYDAKSASYVMDSNRTEIVQLTKTVSTPNQNTWYSPHQVRFRILDSYGAPVTNLVVNATAVGNTLPSDNDLQLIYGINPTAANEMLNQTLIMQGPTGSDGAVVFTMLGSIGYNINMTNPTRGGIFSTYVMPIESQYNIWMNTSTIPGTNPGGSVYLAVQNTTLWFAEPNVSYIRLGVNYTDTSGKTSNVKWYVKTGNNNTVIYTKDLGNPGTGTVTDYQDYKNLRGGQFTWNYTATRLK